MDQPIPRHLTSRSYCCDVLSCGKPLPFFRRLQYKRRWTNEAKVLKDEAYSVISRVKLAKMYARHATVSTRPDILIEPEGGWGKMKGSAGADLKKKDSQ